MTKQKKETPVQTFTLEIPGVGDLRVEGEDKTTEPKIVQPPKKDVNEDLIQRLITCLKKM